ncbi:unnamed protein product, partial [Prorocentrum cordatum]
GFAVMCIQAAADLRVRVYGAASWMDYAAGSVLPSSMVAGTLSLAVAIALVVLTLQSWRRSRHQLASGGLRSTPQWQPEAFGPVRAPALPGLMASSVALAFGTVYLLLFFAIEVPWIGIYTFGLPNRDFLWDQIINLAIAVGVKKLLLDKLVGWRMTRQGFVTH